MSSVSSLIPSPSDIIQDIKDWVHTQGLWWATSVVAHAVILSCGLLLVSKVVPKQEGEAPVIESVDTEILEEIEPFDVGDTPLETTELNTDTLSLTEATPIAQEEQINGSPDEAFEEAGGGTVAGTSVAGGLGGFDVMAMGPGPAVTGAGGIGTGIGTGDGAGSGGNKTGFGGRGAGQRIGTSGGTKGSERAVAAALNWLARHQNPDGGWSLGEYTRQCKDGTCTGKGDKLKSDAGATAMALLPYLAAGQTHETKGMYKKTIYGGLYWLMKNQKNDGNLAGGTTGNGLMYAHGLAAITMCEAYGMSQDRQIGASAQAAINYIVMAQDPVGGGWRYSPKQPGDTSVVGWQVMALKSAQMAGLEVPSPVMAGAAKYLKAASGSKGGKFGYQPGGAGNPTMSAVGLLCIQYMGVSKEDPAIKEGMAYLMANGPDKGGKNCYYWYYATQVMHNLPGYDWDTWNRKMRKVLIESQEKAGCAAGSWNPTGHSHSEAGGRIMVTSLNCLTLEVYYRYLPLYKLDGGDKKVLGKDRLKEDDASTEKTDKKPAPAPKTAAKAAAPAVAAKKPAVAEEK